ncbi:hypothetical protein SFRURICE_020456 [Spodoptera frugiperda]|nr:hypothetical protein SFRURICE_020456 [Spodoptera frugiperda]
MPFIPVVGRGAHYGTDRATTEKFSINRKKFSNSLLGSRTCDHSTNEAVAIKKSNDVQYRLRPFGTSYIARARIRVYDFLPCRECVDKQVKYISHRPVTTIGSHKELLRAEITLATRCAVSSCPATATIVQSYCTHVHLHLCLPRRVI